MPTRFQDENPVTDWIDEMRSGDPESAGKLWQYFFDHLREAMRRRIRSQSRAIYDEEDAALSAFQSLCHGLQSGRYPDIDDRTSLWRLLLVIATRKVMHRHRFDAQEQRDRRREVSLVSLFPGGELDINNLASAQPTPEMIMELEESCNELFDQLEDESLQEVAQMKLMGFTHSEIARDLKITDRTVRRKLERIRRIWEK